MKFRDDIDPHNTWVVSDTHFGHENIVGYCARPEDHDLVMIEQWRAHVPDDATVLHLGDLCYKGNSYFKNVVAKRLTGRRKLLIMGNHDRGRPSFYRDCGFKIVRPFSLHLKDEGNGTLVPWPGDPSVAGRDTSVSFSHYPWNEKDEGGPQPFNHYRVHGHIHNNGYFDGRNHPLGNVLIPFLADHINVSVEQTRYRPVNLGLMLDAALLGRYPVTTDEQLAEARARREERR